MCWRVATRLSSCDSPNGFISITVLCVARTIGYSEKLDKLIAEEEDAIAYHRKLIAKLKPVEKPKPAAKK